jgi:hypothetical protein
LIDKFYLKWYHSEEWDLKELLFDIFQAENIILEAKLYHSFGYSKFLFS